MSRYRGRVVDDVALWADYVEFPNGVDGRETYSPKMVCPHPDHDTFKRHFQINFRDGLVHCFAECGISGTFEHALAVIHGFYIDAGLADARTPAERKRRLHAAHKKSRRIILRHARARIPGEAHVQVHSKRRPKPIAPLPSSDLEYDTFIPQMGMEYLAERGISEGSVSAWQLGWNREERRIVIPARDENGRLRFLIRRAVRSRDQPKYLYTAGYPKTSLLFGACMNDLGMVRSHGLLLVEGSIDKILLHQLGFANSDAILGTGISDAQVRIISRTRPPRIYLMFDKDSAGIHNIQIAAGKLRKYPMYVCRYPSGVEDPAELCKLGREGVERVIDRAIPLSRFMRKTGLSATQRERANSVG
jgi:DNA primase